MAAPLLRELILRQRAGSCLPQIGRCKTILCGDRQRGGFAGRGWTSSGRREVDVRRPLLRVLRLKGRHECGSQHALALPRDAADERHGTLNAIEQEGMGIGALSEDQKDARFKRDRRDAEDLFKVPSRLFLVVVLLKGLTRRK